MIFTVYLFSLFLILGRSFARLVGDGKVTTLNSIPYYIGGTSIAKLSGFSSYTFGQNFPGQDLIPLTILHADGATFSIEEYNVTISDFNSRDDVFQNGFLQIIYVIWTAESLEALEPWRSFAQETHQTKLFLGQGTNVTLSATIPNGPYFVSAATGSIFKTYRLYPDHNLAFTQAAVSDERGGFLAIPGMANSVAVPSRLYYTPSASQPLAGLRMGVKDIFAVKGLKTSGGSRAYYDTYPEQNATAPSVQRLIDLGAVLVGKTATAQFANGDRPTVDWVDYHCPFNPRGDGYQVPSGSSSGSAAAIASYEWLDFAVGSDTGGSMRSPARMNGVFGNRPSTGAVSMDGVLPLSPHFDTAGVFTRSGSLWSTITALWYETQPPPSYPKRIYVSRNSTTGAPAALALFSTFLARLERVLNTTHTVVDIAAHWHATHPPNTTSSIADLLAPAYAVLTAADQHALLAQPFRAHYAAAHAGAAPFVNPNPRARWAWGAAHAPGYAGAVHNVSAFRAWWAAAAFGRPDRDACSEGVYVYAGALGGAPSYRDEYLAPRDAPPLEFADWTVAGYAGAAEVVVPVGEVAYESRVTGRVEWLPVAVNVGVARGCDGVLGALVRRLEEEGVVREVGVGTRLYG